MTGLPDKSVILSERSESNDLLFGNFPSHKSGVPHPRRVLVFAARVGNQKSSLAVLLCAAFFALLTLTSCRSHDFPQYPPNYREYAYITNGGSDTVTVLDVVNVRVDRELAVGKHP